MPNSPRVSVIVPTHNRYDRLGRVLDALAAQAIDEPFEVVVVDDGSTDDTPAELERLAKAHPFLRSIRVDPNGGPAAARNRGWQSAGGSLIAFTDDDCIPEPGWLRALVAQLERTDVVQGLTTSDQAKLRQLGPFGHTVQVPSETGLYETCNIAYRRSVLAALGGFDEGFRYPYGEDTDLAWRAIEAGHTTAFIPDAVVTHEVVTSNFRRHIRSVHRIEGLVLTVSRHPQLRDRFYYRMFYSAAHPRALAFAATGVALLTRPRSPARWLAAVGTGTSWARTAMRERHHPRFRRDWSWVLPLAGVADMYEIAVLARASLRYRTPFL